MPSLGYGRVLLSLMQATGPSMTRLVLPYLQNQSNINTYTETGYRIIPYRIVNNRSLLLIFNHRLTLNPLTFNLTRNLPSGYGTGIPGLLRSTNLAKDQTIREKQWQNQAGANGPSSMPQSQNLTQRHMLASVHNSCHTELMQ